MSGGREQEFSFRYTKLEMHFDIWVGMFSKLVTNGQEFKYKALAAESYQGIRDDDTSNWIQWEHQGCQCE